MRHIRDGGTGASAWPADGSAWPAGGAAATATVGQTRIARRHLLKTAVFGPQHAHHDLDQEAASLGPAGPWHAGSFPRAVTGQVIDASPQVLVIWHNSAEERFALTADASAWRGAKTDPAGIKIGDHVVVRRHGSSREIADRIWANIGRVTGKIVRREGDALLVDRGDGTSQQIVVISARTWGQIQVKFPRLQPGYLVDIIGIRHPGYLEGLVPATYQPTYRADHVPAPPLINGHLPGSIKGAANWHEPGDEPDGLIGLAYPAVDEHGAGEHPAGQAASANPGRGATPGRGSTPGQGGAPGCVSLPYLSIGSMLRVRNDCAKRSRTLPVIGSAATARMFCDRSVSCGPSPRGRIVDLTLASFVELGGELDEGSFNATIEIGA
ncbi:MAG: hypothetical protein ACRDNF_17445 [Streptosporangiaceae bacterium]